MQRKGDRNSHIHDDVGQKISAGIIRVGYVPHRDPYNVEVIAVFRRQSGNIVMEAATVPPSLATHYEPGPKKWLDTAALR